MLRYFSAVMVAALALPAWSAGGRDDYDVDDDGLIEILDLADLDELRNNLLGKTLYGSNAGCPAEGCRGVELTVDLDFDTNQDGVMDASDTYWNDGKGWEPIGEYSPAYYGYFEGNGYVIRNLYINRPEQFAVGLFGGLAHTTIRRTGITGKLAYVSGHHLTGMLAGAVVETNIEGVFSTGRVESGTDQVGGLFGYMFASGKKAKNLFSTAKVTYRYFANDVEKPGGGILGTLSEGGFEAAFAMVPLVRNRNGGDWVRSYYLAAPGANSNYESGTLAELKCPVVPEDAECRQGALYKGWVAEGDGKGTPFWDFGTRDQLPGLVLGDRVFRDGDGDSLLDEDDNDQDNDGVEDLLDAFPHDPLISIDADGDGVPDSVHSTCDLLCQYNAGLQVDAFPNHAAASVDADGDGKPDFWNLNCDLQCQEASGLALDDKIEDLEPPQILGVPAEIVTGSQTFFTALGESTLRVIDNVDSEFTYRLEFDDQTLELGPNDPVVFPVGIRSLKLTAIDSSNNVSLPVTLRVYVPYEVGFKSGMLTVVEGTTAKLLLGFLNGVPDFPVTLQFQLLPLEAGVEDLGVEYFFSLQVDSVSPAGEFTLEIPILEDEDSGPEELSVHLNEAFGTNNGRRVVVNSRLNRVRMVITDATASGSSSSSSTSSSSSGSSSSGSSSSSSSSSSSTSSSGGNSGTSGGRVDLMFLLLLAGLSMVRTRRAFAR